MKFELATFPKGRSSQTELLPGDTKCLKFEVPKVPKIWISANQEIRVQDIREFGYQEKNKVNLISW